MMFVIMRCRKIVCRRLTRTYNRRPVRLLQEGQRFKTFSDCRRVPEGHDVDENYSVPRDRRLHSFGRFRFISLASVRATAFICAGPPNAHGAPPADVEARRGGTKSAPLRGRKVGEQFPIRQCERGEARHYTRPHARAAEGAQAQRPWSRTLFKGPV